MKQIDYIKGSGKYSTGAIFQNGSVETTITFIAVTMASSKTFKSLKGAERYMAKFGYEVVKEEIKEETTVKIEERIAYLRVVK